MFSATITAYPWDLIDGAAEGRVSVDAALDRLHGEIGVTGVSVWAATPPVHYLRAREPEPRVVRTSGGLLFEPALAAYDSTRCKPIVSDCVGDADALARIADACGQRRISLRAIVSASATGQLATAYPAMACQNAFDAVSHASLCLAHTDAQSYLVALLSDLTGRYALDAVVLTDFGTHRSEAWDQDLQTGMPLGDTERSLLAVCLCESCRHGAEAAGVDAAAVARSVRAVIQQSLDTGRATDRSLDALLADNEPLRAFFDRRASALTSLAQRLADVCKCDLRIEQTASPDDADRREIDLSCAAGVITRIDATDQLGASPESSAQRTELGVPASLIAEPHGQRLIAGLAESAGRGITGATFDHYGLLSNSALTRIKQAIRFARRSFIDDRPVHRGSARERSPHRER